MFAIIKTGGKQYRVSEGQDLAVEKLPAPKGEIVELGQVLLVADGKKVIVGRPVVEGASVKAEVRGERRTRKVLTVKKKRRKTYTRRIGHRQTLSVVTVREIAVPHGDTRAGGKKG